MRVTGYPRVSTEEQDFAVQVAKIRAYADLKDLELVEMITLDEGNSGKSLDRPGFNRVLEMFDSGEAEGVIVYKLDRLTRNLKDWCVLIEDYFGEGGNRVLMSVTESVDTRTAGGRLMLNFFVMVAQWERETIVERTKLKLSHKKSIGERTGSIPYGMRLDPTDPRRSKIKKNEKTGEASGNLPIALVPDTEEEAALELIRSNATRPLRWIAAELDRAGYKTKSGRPWQFSTVRKLLGRIGQA